MINDKKIKGIGEGVLQHINRMSKFFLEFSYFLG